MNFQDHLATLPGIDHLLGLELHDEHGNLIHHIPAVAGKLGSLRLYHALYVQYGGRLDAEAARQGLLWFAEHVADARAHPGRHPNIDLLLQVAAGNNVYRLHPLVRP